MENNYYDDFSAMINNYFQHDYRDRGIKKWQGFFLSDHTSALKRFDYDNNYSETPMKQMATSDILRVAMHALANWQSIVMQLNATTYEHDTQKNIAGMIASIDDRAIYIEDSKGETQGYLFEDIRAIKSSQYND
ncbi:hypothetical protein [Leuconostoc pseudomesenteroides]|uniref:hypothetical protein n=1 Tax=Leuconostoc pseudomesenteroides TaxID=33968 RepID=UPI0021A47ED3|nr:hypothetical protein [Leuconostoc pseudomesenteroides]MCT4380611.1 hypothetical protein [Leuconostoc pseudomesenteroides]